MLLLGSGRRYEWLVGRDISKGRTLSFLWGRGGGRAGSFNCISGDFQFFVFLCRCWRCEICSFFHQCVRGKG